MVEELRSMKLKETAKKAGGGIKETLAYGDFPSKHWTRIRINNVVEEDLPLHLCDEGISRWTIWLLFCSVPGCSIWLVPSGATKSAWTRNA